MERQVWGECDLIVLLVQILQKPSHDLKQQLAVYSKRVAGCVTELIQAAEAMKGWFEETQRCSCLRTWTPRPVWVLGSVSSACFRRRVFCRDGVGGP